MKIFNPVKMLLKTLVIGFGLSLIMSCKDNLIEKPPADDTLVGITLVDLDANKVVVRGEEALIGNVVADGMLYYAEQNNIAVDFALTNGGNIRFDSSKRSDGIYPAGNLTVEDIKEILPFGGGLVVVTMSGNELLSTLERGVASLPIPAGDSGSGAFIQASAFFEMQVNLQNPAQVIDGDADVVVTEGTRVTFVKIRGQAFDLNATYKVIVGAYPSSGGDSFYALGNIPDSRKQVLDVESDEILRLYVAANSPLEPTIEGRITIFE